ncbi:tripartite motif-containing protein 66 [Alosa alosa]|uniref:tripartite motif-containing protein 66 n=1 Tax=Alosa alosa TaxID=278164 RepID=UPI0020153357|nr:tripartite motif-containing protein 66 [Alosa alosa]XP_048116282.1 tripartite motif-containing protein 66 [Alosa alosa]
MSVANIQKKLDNIDVGPVEQDVSSAAEGKASSSLENCCVCDTPLHQSRLPQLFPCLHSACRTCLSKQHVEENNRKSIECPSCKKLFGITEITENILFMQSLPSSESDVFKCGGCEELGISGWCKDCGEFLCSECVSAHSRVKLTRSHTIVAQELSEGSHPTQYCPAHREEPLKFFCMTCSQLTCRNCQLVDHRNHSYQMITEAVSALREKLQSLQGQVTKHKEQVKQSELDLDQRLRNIADLKTSLKRKLSLVVSKMHRALLIKGLDLFQSASAVYGREEKQLFQRKTSLRRIEKRQDYIISFIEKTLSIEGHAGILLKNRIESQIKDLLLQSVNPPSSMLELNVQVNQSIMTSVENFGGISLRLVPFERYQSNQSESLLQTVPNLQNVPKDCIINTVTSTSSSPDSSTQEATLLGRSPVASPSHHSQSHNAPLGIPQSAACSSNSPQSSTSSHGQTGPKVCIVNTATSTTSPDTSAQTALHGQSPTVPHSHHSQPKSAPLGHSAQSTLQTTSAPSNAPQSQSASSNSLQLPRSSLPHAQPDVNRPALQHHNAVLPLYVPSTSFQQQSHQSQTAFLVLSTPVISNPPQVLCGPFSIANVTEKSVKPQSAPQVQVHSGSANSSANSTRPSHTSKPELTASHSPLSSHPKSAQQPSPARYVQLIRPAPAQTQSSLNALSASTDSGKAQSGHADTQASTFQPPPSAVVQQVQVSSVDPQHSLAHPTVSPLDQHSTQSSLLQRPPLTKHPQTIRPTSADTGKAQSGHSQSQPNTFQPPPSALVQQVQVVSVDAHNPQSRPAVSSLDQHNPLSSHPKPPPQAPLSASTHSGKAQSGRSEIQSNTSQPPPSALIQQIKVSSVDAQHSQSPPTASPLDQPRTMSSHQKPLQQASQSKAALSNPILYNILQVPSADTQNPQSSKTAFNKSLSLQDPRTMKLIAKRIAMLKKKSTNNFKRRPPKVWKFHECHSSSGSDETNQHSLSGSNASVSSPTGLPDPQSDTQTLTIQQTTSKTQCLEEPSEQRDTPPQLTKDDHNIHTNWLNGLPQSFREILGVSPLEKEGQDSPQTDIVKTEDPQTLSRPKSEDSVSVGDTDSVTSDKAENTVEIKNSTLPEKILRCQVDLIRLDIKLPSTGLSLPRFRVGTDGSLEIIPLPEIEVEELFMDSESSESSPLSLDSTESIIQCQVCSANRATLQCVICERSFHRDCHVPPITTRVCNYKWKCSICQDLSDSTDPFRKDRQRKFWLNSVDQRRCEHLLLALMCKKNNSVLYNSCKDPASSIDFEFIHERLLRRRTPPYRTPSELVSDVWVFLESTLSNAEETEDALRMLKSFKKRVNQVFGNTLHPSLLKRSNVNREQNLGKTGGPIKKETSETEDDSSEDCTEPVIKKRHLD